jgi:hypothetical protein
MDATELMDQLFKFKVGDTVAMTVHLAIRKRGKAGWKKERGIVPEMQPLQILERIAQQCHGGVQMAYLCRPHLQDGFRSLAFGTELVRVLEIELEAMPKEDEVAGE